MHGPDVLRVEHFGALYYGRGQATFETLPPSYEFELIRRQPRQPTRPALPVRPSHANLGKRIEVRAGSELPPAPMGTRWSLTQIFETFPPIREYELVKA